MNSKRKRLIVMLLCLTLFTLIFTACKKENGGNEDTTVNVSDGEKNNNEVNNEPDELVDPLGKYEEGITLRGAWLDTGGTKFIPGNPDYDSAEKNVFVTAYKEKLGIDVVYDWVSADNEAYDTKWNMAMAKQNLPDFGMVNETQYKMLLEAGLVMDMTDIFDQYASEKYKEFLAADGGATLGYSLQDGRMMGLPITGTTPDSVELLYIRKDWLDKLGLPIPKTTDELINTAKAFAENEMGGPGTYGLIGSQMAFGYDLGFLGLMNGYNAYPESWMKDSNGKLVYGSTMDTVKPALLKLQELFKAGLINEDFAVTDGSIAKEDVTSGKVGIAYGTYYLASGVADAAKNDPNVEWAIVEIPTLDGTPAIAQSSVTRSQFIFVNKNCKNPEAVVKLINLEIDLMFNEDSEVVSKYTTHNVGEGDNAQGIQTSKYVASVYFSGMPWQNLTRHEESVKALETGEEDFSIVLSQTTYNNHLKYLDGDISQWNSYHIFGPEGTYSVIGKMWEEGRIILNEYKAIPTDTMTEMKTILDDALRTAMIKVIMGEDISVYEKAVEDWYSNGGQLMTDQVNEWYANNK
jgi:putative aldouronate transport system substrate-binding protein